MSYAVTQWDFPKQVRNALRGVDHEFAYASARARIERVA
jgi:hypothetical protein